MIAPWLPQLIAALMAVETGGAGGDSDGGRAHGPLQIHAAVIADVNRKFGTGYTLADANNLNSAMKMCRRYLELWVPHARAKINRHNRAMAKVGLETNNISVQELAARIWNGGPDGWRRPATLDYWHRVKNLMEGNAEGQGCRASRHTLDPLVGASGSPNPR